MTLRIECFLQSRGNRVCTYSILSYISLFSLSWDKKRRQKKRYVCKSKRLMGMHVLKCSYGLMILSCTMAHASSPQLCSVDSSRPTNLCSNNIEDSVKHVACKHIAKHVACKHIASCQPCKPCKHTASNRSAMHWLNHVYNKGDIYEDSFNNNHNNNND